MPKEIKGDERCPTGEHETDSGYETSEEAPVSEVRAAFKAATLMQVGQRHVWPHAEIVDTVTTVYRANTEYWSLVMKPTRRLGRFSSKQVSATIHRGSGGCWIVIYWENRDDVQACVEAGSARDLPAAMGVAMWSLAARYEAEAYQDAIRNAQASSEEPVRPSSGER